MAGYIDAHCATQETVHEETYLGIPIFRFYIRCPRCAQEISFKTDPENADYKAENGATRMQALTSGEGRGKGVRHACTRAGKVGMVTGMAHCR